MEAKSKTLSTYKIKKVLAILLDTYPDAKVELDHSNEFQLLIATLLSARCTDIRVNIVTKKLFEVLKKPDDIYNLSIEEIEEKIKSLGLYKTKAKNLKKTSEILASKYKGNVPRTKEELCKLPGVGVKTANVVLSNAFGIPQIAVDTHVFRVSNRIGLVDEKTVEKTEKSLEKVIPRKNWTKMHHVLIFHGRKICKSQNPNCKKCPVIADCIYTEKTN